MAVSYLDFKRFSEQSISVEHYLIEEICLRVFVSSSYYALYHRALILSSVLRSFSLEKVSGTSHKKLSDFYLQPFDIKDGLSITNSMKTDMTRLGYVLKTLHTSRVLADYKIDDDLTEIDMREAVRKSDQYIKVADRIFESL